METTVLYHAHCPDGRAAAFACWQVFGEAAQYLPVSYGQPCPAIPPAHNVYIVDFSYDAETLKELVAARLGRRGREEDVVTVLDHHRSAERDLTSLMRQQLPGLRICFDMQESGASLTWKWFHTRHDLPNPTHQPDVWGAVDHAMPLLFHFVRDRDLWRFALQDSHAISMAYRTVMMQPFIDLAQFAQDLDEAEGYYRIVTEGQAMLRYAGILVEEQAAKVQWAMIGGYHVPCANATTLFSEVGESLCRAYPEAPFAAYFGVRTDGKVQWGLRGQGKLDLSVIAKEYGGGGHHDASGFVTTLDALNQILIGKRAS